MNPNSYSSSFFYGVTCDINNPSYIVSALNTEFNFSRVPIIVIGY